MKIDTGQTTSEIHAALIGAASRVYAAGLEAANNTNAEFRRERAAGDVAHFLKTLESHSKAIPTSFG